MIYNAKYSLEYICFHVTERPTSDSGNLYFFSFMDVLSGYVLSTGYNLSGGKEAVLKHIRLLGGHKDFRRSKGQPFTLLVGEAHAAIAEDIQRVLAPMGGRVVVDEAFVAKQFAPFLEKFLR